MLIKTKGVILGSIKYGDNSCIATIFTQFDGMLSFLYKKTSGRKHIANSAIYLPMTLLDIEFNYRSNRNIQFFTDVSMMSDVQNTSLQNPYKNAIKMFLAEVLRYSLKKEVDCSLIFEFIENRIGWLNDAKYNYSDFHISFMLDLLKYLGYDPTFDSDFKINLRTRNHDERNHCTEILLNYYKQHIPAFPDIKSWYVLKEVFD